MLIPMFQKRIEEEILALRFPGQPISLYDPAAYILSLGGKRIRPVLTLMGCALFRGDIEQAVNPAIALEIFHNFTLVHDDLMDHADLRRGKETVHRKWNESTAILSGDVMLVLAYEKLVKGMAAPLIPGALNLFNSTARKVCEGQEWDMLFERRDNVTIEEYLKMIGLKTATLLAGALQIGSLIAGAATREQELIYVFGYTLGIAFQIQDDLLDTYGTEGFGKRIGGDIQANKKTYLALKAMELAKTEDRVLMQGLFSGSGQPEKIDRVMGVYQRCDVRRHAEKARDAHFDRAMRDLTEIKGDEAVKEELKSLARSLINREK